MSSRVRPSVLMSWADCGILKFPIEQASSLQYGAPKHQNELVRGGHTVGEFRLVEVRLHDWEDIAIDEQNFLYVGDLGNNELRRHELAVYRIDEPNPTNKVGFVHLRASWRLLYPGKPFDCE